MRILPSNVRILCNHRAMRASRLLSILILLQMRGRLSAEALAEEFEVSVRTIYRDVDQLSAAGVPIYAERGRNGGFQLHDGYRTKLTGFTAQEADALLLSGVGAAAQDLGLGPDLAAAQLKLLASLPPESGASAERVSARFHLDPVNWYTRADASDVLKPLAAAVWNERRIRVRYESWKAVVERALDPLGLVLKGGVWYLVAAVKAAPRTYRVSNILEMQSLETAFTRPRRFNLSRYWSEWSKEFETRLLKEHATIEVSATGRRLLRDTNAAAYEALAADHKPCKPEGWVRARVPIENIDSAKRQFLRLGADVKVIEPPALRAAITEETRKIAAHYKR
ncbi:MAG: WYL domain-containing protein [Hyphomonadaceae bacterium]|nr:WYL domain-containing protein [Hyphomonadaceae bacterium]